MKNEYKNIIVTITIIAINVVTFIALEILGGTENIPFMIEHGASYPELIRDKNEYWRLFTSTYLHFGMKHLFNNMLVLAAAGKILEEAVGHIKFLIIYTIAGISGSIASYFYMINSNDYAAAAGASGAVFGLVGALLWVVIRHKGCYEDLTSANMIFLIFMMIAIGVTSAGVDNRAHVGGLVSGFVACVLLYRKKVQRIDFDDENQYTNDYSNL